MNIGILTFQFAHNYGALLQAYALKTALSNKGADTQIINFIPTKAQREYSLNPFVAAKSIRSFAGSFKRFPKRLKQYRKFVMFQKRILGLSDPIFTENDLNLLERKCDAVIVGSDQVWNTKLSGTIGAYYLLSDIGKTRRYSYAASFGTTTINETQINYLKSAMKLFSCVSVRETSAADIIYMYTGVRAEIVMDPVFLLPKDIWISFAEMVNRKEKKQAYILYYTLAEDNELKKLSEKLSYETGLPISVIHPTIAINDFNGKLLRDVGPIDFVWLIMNAAYVVSNSFHATAFSVIFGKKLCYRNIKNLQTRVQSLFEILKVKKEGNQPIYDLSSVDGELLKGYIDKSHEFLDRIILEER